MKKITLIILQLFLVSFAFSWDFQPKEMGRIGPAEEEATDAKGQPCSLLYIQTEIEDLEIFGGIRGLCRPLEKTDHGYKVFLRSNTKKLDFIAPNFNGKTWEFKPLLSKYAYKVKLLKQGKDPAKFNAETMSVQANAQLFSNAVASFESGDDLSPRIMIYTDLPFETLQAHFLNEGTYTVEAETKHAPYALIVPENTSAENVFSMQNLAFSAESQEPLATPLAPKHIMEVDLTWSEKEAE